MYRHFKSHKRFQLTRSHWSCTKIFVGSERNWFRIHQKSWNFKERINNTSTNIKNWIDRFKIRIKTADKWCRSSCKEIFLSGLFSNSYLSSTLSFKALFGFADQSASHGKCFQPLAEKNRFDNRAQSNLDTGYFPAKLDGKEGYDILHKGIYWQSGTNGFVIIYSCYKSWVINMNY